MRRNTRSDVVLDPFNGGSIVGYGVVGLIGEDNAGLIRFVGDNGDTSKTVVQVSSFDITERCQQVVGNKVLKLKSCQY